MGTAGGVVYWEDASTWADARLRRDVFFFASGQEHLHGSLYRPAAGEAHFGVVVCPSWGAEFNQFLSASHALARRVAGDGGAVLLFHWPGHGDSTASADGLALAALCEAAVDAVDAARTRSATPWGIAGVRLGAAIASATAARADAAFLVLVEPAMDVERFHDRLRRSSRIAQLVSAGGSPFAYAHPLPAPPADLDPAAGLAAYRGPVAAVAYEATRRRDLPEGVRIKRVPGEWERANRVIGHPDLVRKAARLCASLGEAVAGA